MNGGNDGAKVGDRSRPPGGSSELEDNGRPVPLQEADSRLPCRRGGALPGHRDGERCGSGRRVGGGEQHCRQGCGGAPVVGRRVSETSAKATAATRCPAKGCSAPATGRRRAACPRIAAAASVSTATVLSAPISDAALFKALACVVWVGWANLPVPETVSWLIPTMLSSCMRWTSCTVTVTWLPLTDTWLVPPVAMTEVHVEAPAQHLDDQLVLVLGQGLVEDHPPAAIWASVGQADFDRLLDIFGRRRRAPPLLAVCLARLASRTGRVGLLGALRERGGPDASLPGVPPRARPGAVRSRSAGGHAQLTPSSAAPEETRTRRAPTSALHAGIGARPEGHEKRSGKSSWRQQAGRPEPPSDHHRNYTACHAGVADPAPRIANPIPPPKRGQRWCSPEQAR